MSGPRSKSDPPKPGIAGKPPPSDANGSLERPFTEKPGEPAAATNGVITSESDPARSATLSAGRAASHGIVSAGIARGWIGLSRQPSAAGRTISTASVTSNASSTSTSALSLSSERRTHGCSGGGTTRMSGTGAARTRPPPRSSRAEPKLTTPVAAG